MKVLNQKLAPLFWTGILSLGLSVGISACGSAAAPNGVSPPTNVPFAGAMPMYGVPNNYAGANTIMSPNTGMGCFPITAPIPFSAQGAFISATTVKAGIIPLGTNPAQPIDPYARETPGRNVFGTVYSGGMVPGATLMVQASNLRLADTGVDGNIQIAVTPLALNNPAAAITGGPANLMGVVQVSPARAQVISMTSGSSFMNSMFTGMGGMGSMYGAVPCVSSIAFSMSYATVGGGFQLNGGKVFLYLNGTPHGTYLWF